jgi:hypothetical protein
MSYDSSGSRAVVASNRGGVVARVRGVSGELVTIASLNTRGIPLTGSQLAERYAVIGGGFEAGDAEVVCCQVAWLGRPELCVINTHPVANNDGDWSEANRF